MEAAVELPTDALASWHLWVACQICQFLSVGDLLNYVCAVRPGGYANQLRDRLRPKKEAIDKFCSDFASLPVIGRPTSLVTNLVVGQASSIMSPLLKSVTSKLPPTDQVLLWSLATAKCVKHFIGPEPPQTPRLEDEGTDKPIDESTRDGITKIQSLSLANSSGKKLWHVDSSHSKLPSMHYAEARVEEVFEELKEGLGSLANLIGLETLIKILPFIAAMGGSNKTPPLLITEVFSPISPADKLSDVTDSAEGCVSDAGGGSSVSSIKNSSGSGLFNFLPSMRGTQENHPVQPLSTPIALDQEERSTWSSIPLIGDQVGHVRRVARKKLVGAVRQWTPGGVIALYDYLAPTDLPRDETKAAGKQEEERGRTPHGSPPLNIAYAGVSSRSNGSFKEGLFNDSSSSTDSSELMMEENRKKKLEEKLKLEQEKVFDLWLDEVSYLNDCDDMCTISGYRELIPEGITYGDLSYFQRDPKLHKRCDFSSDQTTSLQEESFISLGQMEKDMIGALPNQQTQSQTAQCQEALPAPVSPRSLRRMKRMMHYQINIAPFQVTVQLPSNKNSEFENERVNEDGKGLLCTTKVSSGNQDLYVDVDQELRSSVSSNDPHSPSEYAISQSSSSSNSQCSPSQSGSRTTLSPDKKKEKRKKRRGSKTMPVTNNKETIPVATESGTTVSTSFIRMMESDLLPPPPPADTISTNSKSRQKDSTLSKTKNKSKSSTTSAPAVVAVPCTPQSFPPSPSYRADIMERGSLAADDTIFAVRDQLRRALQVLHFDPNVRAVAEYLDRRKATAIFNLRDCSNNLSLARGGHCVSYYEKQPKSANKKSASSKKSPTKVPASISIEAEASLNKVGSVRTMVPVLHNRHVCFQYTIYQEQIRLRNKFVPISSGGTSRGGSFDAAMDGMTNSLETFSSNYLTPQHIAHEVSVGLSTGEMPIDCKYGCGSYPHSIGISGNGSLYIDGQEMTHAANRSPKCFSNRSTVSFMVFRDNERCHEVCHHDPTQSCSKVWVSIFVDGQSIISDYDIETVTMGEGLQVIQLIVPRDLVLFPTVSFRSPGWRVNGHFSAADMISEYRKDSSLDLFGCEGGMLPAATSAVPPESVVYALDGSVVRYPAAQTLS